MSNSQPKKTTKGKGRVRFMLITLLVILLVATGYLLQQKSLAERQLEEQSARNKELTEQKQFFNEQARIDTLLLEGKTDEAMELYEDQISRADSSYKALAKAHFQVAKKLVETQQQYREESRYRNIALKEEKQLKNLRDSLKEVSHSYSARRDSLSREIISTRKRMQSLQREINEKAGRNFLTFNSSKGNKVYYMGEIEDDKANGQGVGIWLTGSKYEGKWKDNMRHGEGVFEWEDGERYEGEYRNDLREGQGVYYWSNGQKYVGGWADDKRSGEGVFYDQEGEVLAEGLWKNDELVRVEKEK